MLMIKNILTEMKNSFLMCSEKKVGIAEERISVLEKCQQKLPLFWNEEEKKNCEKDRVDI